MTANLANGRWVPMKLRLEVQVLEAVDKGSQEFSDPPEPFSELIPSPQRPTPAKQGFRGPTKQTAGFISVSVHQEGPPQKKPQQPPPGGPFSEPWS